MKRRQITLANVAEPANPAAGSQCLKVGNMLYISGQIAYDNGELVGRGDAIEQCRQCFRHIRSYVEKAGGSMDDVVALNIFLSDIRYRQASFDSRAEVFSAPGPTATVVGGVDFAFEGLLVEISASAVLPE